MTATIEEAAMHRNVGNIGTPDVVGPLDGDTAQQVRIDLVARRRTAQVRFGVESFDASDAHEPLHPFAVDLQHDGHPAAAEERAFQIQFVQLPEQPQVLGALRPRLVIVGRARHAEQFALLLHSQTRMLRIDP
jgi:hypothetical protein